MVSGALILPSKDNLFIFLKKRSSKLIVPTICWTVIYLTLDFVFHEYHFNAASVTYRILSSLFSPQGHGILWYMYALMGFYLVVPIISPWLRNATLKELLYCVILILLAFSIPYIALILDVGRGPQSNLFYFSGFGGYFILGYFLHNNPNVISMKLASLGMIISVVLPVIIKISNIEVDYFSLFWYLSLPVAAMCIFWFKGIQRFSKYFDRLSINTKRIISLLSSYSFGIYLCHILFMKYLVKRLDFIQNTTNAAVQTALIFIITLACSLIFVIFISKTKLGRYLFATK